ncbi:hypothetical protein [Nitrobacter vulgaris]
MSYSPGVFAEANGYQSVARYFMRGFQSNEVCRLRGFRPRHTALSVSR